MLGLDGLRREALQPLRQGRVQVGSAARGERLQDRRGRDGGVGLESIGPAALVGEEHHAHEVAGLEVAEQFQARHLRQGKLVAEHGAGHIDEDQHRQIRQVLQGARQEGHRQDRLQLRVVPLLAEVRGVRHEQHGPGAPGGHIQEAGEKTSPDAPEGHSVHDDKLVGHQVQALSLGQGGPSTRVEGFDEGSTARVFAHHQHLGLLLSLHPQGKPLHGPPARSIPEDHGEGRSLGAIHREPEHAVLGQVGPTRAEQDTFPGPHLHGGETARFGAQQQIEGNAPIRRGVSDPQGLHGNLGLLSHDLDGQGHGPRGTLEGFQLPRERGLIQDHVGLLIRPKPLFQVEEDGCEDPLISQGRLERGQSGGRRGHRRESVRQHRIGLACPAQDTETLHAHGLSHRQVATLGQQEARKGKAGIDPITEKTEERQQDQAGLDPVQPRSPGTQACREPTEHRGSLRVRTVHRESLG